MTHNSRPLMPSHRRGILLVLVAALIWSSGGLFIKLLELDPLPIAGWRSLVAAMTLVLAARVQTARTSLRPDAVGMAAAVAYAGMMVLFVVATKWTTAANAIFLQFSAPIYLVFLEPLVFRRPLHGRDLAAVLVCMLGMSLFFVGKLNTGRLAGNLLGVLAGTCLAMFTLFLKLKRERSGGGDPLGAIILGNILVALVCLPSMASAVVPTGRGVAALLYLGIFQIGIAYLLFNAGMAHLSATAAVVVGSLEAVLNPVWVFLGVGERPSSWALAGGGLVLGVIVWYGLSGQRAKEGPATGGNLMLTEGGQGAGHQPLEGKSAVFTQGHHLSTTAD